MTEGVVQRIRAAGGEIYAISSEPQRLADEAHRDWELDFDSVGDPHQEIPAICSARGWLTLYANKGDLDFLQRGTDWTVEHPKGFFQPGIVLICYWFEEKHVTKKHMWLSPPATPKEIGMHFCLATD